MITASVTPPRRAIVARVRSSRRVVMRALGCGWECSLTATGRRTRGAAPGSVQKPRRQVSVDRCLLLPEQLVQLGLRLLVVLLRDDGELLRVRQDLPGLQEGGARQGSEARLLRPLLVEEGDLSARLERVDLLRRDVPADAERLARPTGVLDRTSRVARADVDVLDHVDVLAVAGEERLVGVVGLRRVVGDAERARFGREE